MNCDEVEQHLMDQLAGTLEGPAAEAMREHLASCPRCRAEADGLGELWLTLGLIRDEEPDPDLRRRFRHYLEGAMEGASQAPPAPSAPRLGDRLRDWLFTARPMRPAAQLAAAAFTLAIGLAFGLGLPDEPAARDQVADLREEVSDLNRLVSLSLLRQESASDRLQGVSYGSRAGDDAPVLAALLETLSSDPSVNVRLAAVDALAAFAERPPVREALLAGLERERSPLVLIALADSLVESGASSDAGKTRDALRRLADDPGVDEVVRQHLRRLIA